MRSATCLQADPLIMGTVVIGCRNGCVPSTNFSVALLAFIGQSQCTPCFKLPEERLLLPIACVSIAWRGSNTY